MIKAIGFLILVSLTTTPPSHDAMIAVFKLSLEGEDLTLDLSFDIEDYCISLSTKQKEVTVEQLTQYLNEVTSWEINDSSSASLTVTSLTIKGEHYHATCKLSTINTDINKLDILNKFLLPIEGHSNIIMLDLNDTFRDFRMHAKRTTIEVKY